MQTSHRGNMRCSRDLQALTLSPPIDLNAKLLQTVGREPPIEPNAKLLQTGGREPLILKDIGLTGIEIPHHLLP